MSKYQEFISKLIQIESRRIKTIVRIGSNKGINHPELSDIDLLVVVAVDADKNSIARTVKSLEVEIFHIAHKPLTYWLQRHLLATDDPRGIHLLLISEDQLKDNRLKLGWLSNLFVSETLFLNSIRKEGVVEYGQFNYIDFKKLPLGASERLVAFTFPLLLLILVFTKIFNRNEFIVWCVKSLKIHLEIIEDYSSLTTGKQSETQTLPEEIIYRYQPDKYTGRRSLLWLRIFSQIIKNSGFLFGRAG